MIMNEIRRDTPAIFQNESVTVVLDTFYDRRNGFLFTVGAPSGTRSEIKHTRLLRF